MNDSVEENQTVLISTDGVTYSEKLIKATSPSSFLNPLAQTFILDSAKYPMGLFVSSVELAFKTVADVRPVLVSLRRVVNGLPCISKIIPFGLVWLYPSDITTSTDGAILTKATFSAPVFLSSLGNPEYAIVIEGPADYSLFYATAGSNELNTVRKISSSTIGNFFEAQNGSLWLSDNTKSLQMKINKCKFTSGSATAVFNSEYRVPSKVVTGISINNEGSAYADGIISNVDAWDTESTRRIKIYQRGTATETTFPKVRGVVEGGAIQSIEIVDDGSTSFDVTPTIIVAGVVGADMELEITEIDNDNKYIDNFYMNSKSLTQNENDISTDIKYTLAIQTDSDKLNSVDMTLPPVDWTPITLNQKQTVETEMKITPPLGSMKLRQTLSGTSTDVSPVIDSDFVSIATMENEINNVSTNETDATGGNAKSKYISRNVMLEENFESNDISVYATINKMVDTDVKVYGRFIPTEYDGDFELVEWTELTPETDIVSIDENDFREVLYTPNTDPGVYLDSFKAFAIKVVLLSSGQKYSKVTDLRAIALAPIPKR